MTFIVNGFRIIVFIFIVIYDCFVFSPIAIEKKIFTIKNQFLQL